MHPVYMNFESRTGLKGLATLVTLHRRRRQVHTFRISGRLEDRHISLPVPASSAPETRPLVQPSRRRGQQRKTPVKVIQTNQISFDLPKEITSDDVRILRESLQSITISRRNTGHQSESRLADQSTDRGNTSLDSDSKVSDIEMRGLAPYPWQPSKHACTPC